jgi:hypothetical protein
MNIRETLHRAWHEPLMRFLLLGLVLFAVDHALNGARSTGDARIVVTATQQAALAEAFRAEHGRAPQPAELQAGLDRWIDEQVLYREALALGLDRRDLIVQRQMTQKMRFLIEDAAVLPEPSESELQAWLDQHIETYGHPSTVSFEQVFLSRGRHGARLQDESARVARQLQQLPDAFVGLGDPFLVGQVVSSADAARLRREFGADFAESLHKLPQGRWAGPVVSSFGLHLVRVTQRGGFRPATLAEAGDRVRRDYLLAQRETQNREALAQLRARYRIEIEGREHVAG